MAGQRKSSADGGSHSHSPADQRSAGVTECSPRPVRSDETSLNRAACAAPWRQPPWHGRSGTEPGPAGESRARAEGGPSAGRLVELSAQLVDLPLLLLELALQLGQALVVGLAVGAHSGRQ